MKKTLMAMVVATLCATPAIAKTDLNVLSDELNIMKSIMQTAMRQTNDRKGIRVRSIDATYLAGQGRKSGHFGQCGRGYADCVAP